MIENQVLALRDQAKEKLESPMEALVVLYSKQSMVVDDKGNAKENNRRNLFGKGDAKHAAMLIHAFLERYPNIALEFAEITAKDWLKKKKDLDRELGREEEEED